MISTSRKIFWAGSKLASVMMIAVADICLADGMEEATHTIGRSLPVWAVIPFAGILLSITRCPLLTLHFWHQNFGKISAFWVLLFALPFLYVHRGVAAYEILHILLIDYVSFIILLWGLFTISGSIVVNVSFLRDVKDMECLIFACI